MQELLQAVSTVGFPIFMCLLMYKSNNEESQRHKDEMDKVVEAINNNTIALTNLVDKMDD